jgi:hypothetical protein
MNPDQIYHLIAKWEEAVRLLNVRLSVEAEIKGLEEKIKEYEKKLKEVDNG